MNTRDEEYMIALEECRSITRAAERLHVSQPTLSIFLSNMEKNYGVLLFHRIGKKLVPTPAGEAYIRHARLVLMEEQDLLREMLLYSKGQRGELHIGSTYQGGLAVMPPAIREMSRLYPEVRFILHDESASRLEELLENGTVDVIYTNYPVFDDRLMVEEVCRDHLLLVLPKDHPAAESAAALPGSVYPYLDIKLVEQEPMFLMDTGRAIRRRVEAAFSYAGVYPSDIRPLEHIEIGCRMAAEGLGVAFTMEQYVRSHARPWPVRCFRVGDPETYTPWLVAYRKGGFIPPYLSDFIRVLREQL